MKKAVYIPWEDVPEMIADYFSVPADDVLRSDGGITVIVEKRQDETDCPGTC